MAQRLRVLRAESLWPETRITLYHHGKRITIENYLNRGRMPFAPHTREADFYSFSFPFHFSGAPTLWVENGLGFHRLPADYLPGALTSGAAPQHTLALSGHSEGRSLQVVLAQRESFFTHLPTRPGGEPGELADNSIRATVLRKNDQGDTKDWGVVNFPELEPGLEGPHRFGFAFTSLAGEFDPVTAFRLGEELNVPLLTAELPPSMAPQEPEQSFLSLSVDHVVVRAFKPIASFGDRGHYILRLQEVAGREAEVEVSLPFQPSQAERVTLTEDRVLGLVPEAPLRLRVQPHETVTVKLALGQPEGD